MNWDSMDVPGLTEGVGSVGGGRHNDPGLRVEAAVDLGDGIAEAVEENDVVRGDACPASPRLWVV